MVATLSRPVASPFRSRRHGRGWWIALGIFVVLLVGFRLALPTIVHRYVSNVLDNIPPYHGVVGDIGIHLWRGAYSIENLQLVKRDGKVDVPFFAADRIDLAVRWAALLHGKLVAKVLVVRPKINFVAATPEGDQTEISGSWQEKFSKLFPLNFDQITLRNGEVWFHNYTSHPPVNMKLDQLQAEARNLTNSQRLSKKLVTTIDADGRLQGSGRLHAIVHSNILSKPPSFTMELSVDSLDITELNDFLKAYANITANSGKFSLYSNIESEDGEFHGYLKPLIEHLQILDFKSGDPIHLVWESIVSGFIELLKNQSHDRLATVIPVSGNVHQPKMAIIQSLLNVFRNAFIKAFGHDFEPKGVDAVSR